MNIWYVDLETVGVADLKKVGMHNYAQDPHTNISLLGIRPPDARYTTVIPHPAIRKATKKELELLKRFLTEATVVCAHNAAFEKTVFEFCLTRFVEDHGFSVKANPRAIKSICTRFLSNACYGPASLEKACKFFGVAKKFEEGAALMKRVCVATLDEPKRKIGKVMRLPYEWKKLGDTWIKAGPDVYEVLEDYCAQDVDSCYELHQKLTPLFDKIHPGEIRDLVLGAQRATEKMTIPIYKPRLDKLLPIAKHYIAEADKLTQEFCGLNAQQKTAILRHLKEKHGVELHSLSGPVIAAYLAANTKTTAAHTFLKDYARLNKNSLRKIINLPALINDGEIKNSLVFCGAYRTGRWSAHGFQPQNLPRPTHPVHEVLAFLDKPNLSRKDGPDLACSAIRTLIHKPHEKMFNADLAQIELRLALYHGGHKKELEMLHRGEDLYQDFADQIGVSRDIGKITILSLQFGAGAENLMSVINISAKEKIDEMQARALVRAFRKRFSGITMQWKKYDFAIKTALAHGGDFATRLRSGRLLCYGPLKKTTYRTPEGKVKTTISFFNGSEYKSIWGGTVFQNTIQGEARDLMLVKSEPVLPYTHLPVHDEVLATTDFGWSENPPLLDKWWPGLPVDSTQSFVSEYYK